MIDYVLLEERLADITSSVGHMLSVTESIYNELHAFKNAHDDIKNKAILITRQIQVEKRLEEIEKEEIREKIKQ